MTMNKKTKSIIAITSVAAVLTFVFGYGIPVGDSSVEVSLIAAPSVDLAKQASLVIIGEVTSDRTVATNDDDYPSVQLTTLLVHEVLKGTYPSTHIELRDFGQGAFVKNGLRYESSAGGAPIYTDREQVLVFLEYDQGNVLGDGYYVLSSAFGKYEIDGVIAKNIDSNRNESVADIKQKINRALM